MSTDIELDTTVHEPSPTASEVDTAFFNLDRARAQFAWKVGGLDQAGLTHRHPPSTTTLGGLIKHLAQVEDTYVARFLLGEPLGAPWDQAAATGEPVWEWAYRSAAEDSPEQLYQLWQDCVARSRAAWTRALDGGGLDQPSALRLPDGDAVNLRRALIDTVEEYQRHTGHADLLREAVDGRVGNDPPQPQ